MVDYSLPQGVSREAQRINAKEKLGAIIKAADEGLLWATDCEAFMGVPRPYAIASWELVVENITKPQKRYSSKVDYGQRLEQVGTTRAASTNGVLVRTLVWAARRFYGSTTGVSIGFPVHYNTRL
jgi:hypothetical protein